MTTAERRVTVSDSAPASEGLAPGQIREILELFEQSGWNALHLSANGVEIAVAKTGPLPTCTPTGTPTSASADSVAPAVAPAVAPDAPPASAAAAPTPPPASLDAEVDLVEARSPTVGTFWHQPGPGKPPFVRVGDVVSEGQQLGIVEVMKLMNPVTAPVDGTVERICVGDAEMVEYDQVVVLLRPADG